MIERIPWQHEPGHRVALSRRWLAALTTAWGVVILYVAQAALPENVLTLPWQEPTTRPVASTAPQGWAFFTKSPRDAELTPYRLDGGKWGSVRLTPHSKPSNAFGLDRASRSQGIEAALLVSVAGKKVRWRNCTKERTAEDCLASTPNSGKVTNPSPAPSLCGTAALVQMKPTPWAWRDLLKETHTPEKAAVWEVSC
ncbi:SdpA family antimicrobial peptide system protein [Streptomyces alboflavus]|uniref:SdpA family antimicrobial peptide system protein n=1 Tax=Streptomyces alboflavus TaxID=67267 RepID=UPI00068F0F44|nr:SdpA family antimicrobial peptide system protein [Streptomyces alboflavus]